jgi:hypothetical protein
MQARGFTFWFRRSISRLALVLGICCVVELFMHLTEGTKPNTRMPLEYWPYFVTGMGVASFAVAWLTYIPPACANSPSDRDAQPPAANRTTDSP